MTARTADGTEWTVRSSRLGYLHADDGLVAFARDVDGDYVQYLLLVATGEVLQVGTGTVGGDVLLGGDTVAWRSYTDLQARHPITSIVRCRCD